MTASPPTSVISGVHIHQLTRDALLERLESLLTRGEPATILNVNVHALNLAVEQPWFRDFLNTATIAFCDGFGVKWASAFLGQPLPERFTPPDWLDAFCGLCRRLEAGLFFLGAASGVADQAAEALSRQVSGLTVSGTHHGYFNKTPGHAENEAVIQAINQSGARVLLVGFGMPLQEQWLKENRDRR